MADINLSESEISNIVRKVLGISSEKKRTNLTAAEASNLWNQYMGDSEAICINTYFLQIVEDKEVKQILDFALQLSKNHISKITQFFNQANYPIPIGFSVENDVNLNAPRLFSDEFLVYYTEIMAVHGLNAYSLAISSSGREDIREFFIECGAEATDLLNQVISFSKSKGFYFETPIISPPEHVQFVEKKGVISDLFGDPKPLTVSEINNIFFNLKKTMLATTSGLAFIQVAQSEDVRNFLIGALERGKKHIESLAAILHQDNLPTPRTWDADVTNSTISPFSENLMMFHIGFKVSAAIAYYGAGLGTSMRADVVVTYNKIIIEAMKSANEWLTLMVKKGWLEKQPTAVDRKALAKS